MGNNLEGSGRSLILRSYPGIILDRLRKITKNLSQDSRSLGQDLNPGPPKYEAGVLTTRSRLSLAGSVYVGFVVDKVALGQVFLRVLRFSPVNIIPPRLSLLTYHLGDEQQTRWRPQFRDVVWPRRHEYKQHCIVFNPLKTKLV
jgi:hypothetical protein